MLIICWFVPGSSPGRANPDKLFGKEAYELFSLLPLAVANPSLQHFNIRWRLSQCDVRCCLSVQPAMQPTPHRRRF